MAVAPRDDLIHPVLLCGGSGTRLWPLSRPAFPKQFAPLTSDKSLLQQTVLRFVGNGFAAPILVCNATHREIVAHQLADVGVAPSLILLEPEGRSTAPAAAVAALAVQAAAPGAAMVVLPTDHAIGRPERLLAAIHAARPVVGRSLVVFGVTPTGPHTGYGYIHRGRPLNGVAGAFHVEWFTEKPSAHVAEQYLHSGQYLWNSGAFFFSAELYLNELRRLRPEIVAACERAFAGAASQGSFLNIDAAAFGDAPSISIDHAVMEKTDRAVVFPVEIDWSDVGSWSALHAVSRKGEDGNVTSGRVVALDVQDSYLRSDGPVLGAIGLKDIVVVATGDAVLVADRRRSEEVGRIAQALEELRGSPRERWRVVERGDRLQLRRLTVHPAGNVTLPPRDSTNGCCIVLSGRATVIRGGAASEVPAGQAVPLSAEAGVDLANHEQVPLELLDVEPVTAEHTRTLNRNG